MTRYTLFALIVMGSAATAIAAIVPDRAITLDQHSQNVTVIEKNQAWPQIGPLTVEECRNEDCSGTEI
jgi:hypothetical protein